MWRNFVEPPPDQRDWLRLEHELWVWATRPGNDQARDRLGRRYGAEYALLAETIGEWADEGLIDPPIAPGPMATVLVSALLGLEMTHRLDPSAVGEEAAVRALKALLRAT